MTHTEILRRIAEKGTLIGQCAAIWYRNRKTDRNGKIYVLECAEMCKTEWIRDLWGEELVKSIRKYAMNYRGKKQSHRAKTLVIGNSIKEIRLQKGIKQNALAIAVGIKQGSLSKIENKNLFLDKSTVEKIATELNVSSTLIVKFL